MTEPAKIRVLCVDDHPLIRDGIAFALLMQKDMELVGEATNGEEAIEQFRHLRPDVTLMDLQLPVLDGFGSIARIREEFPKARFIALTTYAGDVQASRAFKAGASGYLLKNMLRAEMVDTIRAVHQGLKRVPAEIANSLAERLSANDLSTREIEVLQSVAAGNSNKIVASQLSISEDTVKGHMKSILVKLNANDRTHAVLIAIKRGFIKA
jgi:DNA-binding NarL/FixJ family response regulator